MEERVGVDGHDGETAHAPIGTDEVGHEGGGRAAEHLVRRVVLLDVRTLGQHGDAVAQERRLVDVVGDEDDRLLQLLLQLQQLLLQPLAA